MKKLILLLIVPVFFGFKTGDEIDEKRMNRDLEIAKNILATLIQSGSDSFFGSTSIDASYIKDYGVVFSIPEHLVYFHGGGFAMPEMPPFPEVDVDFDVDDDFEIEFENQEELENQKKVLKKHKKEIEKHEKELQKHAEEMDIAREEMEKAKIEANEGRRQTREIRQVYVTNGQANEIDWEDVMVTFMTDYADLIGQLQPNEKIVVKQKSPYNEMVFVWSGENSGERTEHTKGNISAEVLRKDVSAYKAGKIKKEEFVSRIDIKKSEAHKKVADLEMFANIFDRFYSHDLTESYYSQGKPSYEVLEGFGAVFHIKASSGKTRAYARARYRVSGSDALTIKPQKSEENEKSEDEVLYPKFKDDIKAFMLDYGRTIRSLKDNEKVMLDIKISSCRGCNIPASMEVSTKMSVLKQYDQQKLSREKAMDEIEIKENF